jgi:hypothetical protein
MQNVTGCTMICMTSASGCTILCAKPVLGSHATDCDPETMAANLKPTPNRLRPMLTKLQEQGAG